MKKTSILLAAALLSLAAVSCRQGGKAEPQKISIFCDHIETVARQEGISFAEAATRIKAMGYEGADILSLIHI